jgi:uncharacterized protein (TIGR02117 family)
LAVLLLALPPALYLLAALIGSLVPVNRGWEEPANGVTIYLASNGVHVDILMPVEAEGLDWAPLLPKSDVAQASDDMKWVAFGTGERAIYLETPTWSDLRVPTAARALTRGERILHVSWAADPSYAVREIRLRPQEYRRLWAAIRASFRDARPKRIEHKGYGRTDAFYEGIGHASAFDTCNQWVASRLRLAGIETSLWTPFAQGVAWRYRRVRQST